MLLVKDTGESYWNSYRLLEDQLIRLSHSISFDDAQVDVYSSELADIINSACIKIESLAKDIYEEHILPFQIDCDMIPKSYKGSVAKFKFEKWTRDTWKYDYNCLVEIDEKFSLSKKRLRLKTERFHFFKYGSTILPFSNIEDDCKGGSWEYSSRDRWIVDTHKLVNVDWCKSYQAIKHDYINSISKHGTIKNAIIALSAFYLLAVYNSCLPSRHFDIDYSGAYPNIDFDSKMFSCEICNNVLPDFIDDSSRPNKGDMSYEDEILIQQELLNSTDGITFFVTLNKSAYFEAKRLVAQYCETNAKTSFDIAPYKRSGDNASMDAGYILYLNLKKYIVPPYDLRNVCVTFNTGMDLLYRDYVEQGSFDYERSKYKNKREEILASLKVGDAVEVKFIFDDIAVEGVVKKIDAFNIDLQIDREEVSCLISESPQNIIHIKKKD